MSSRFNQGFTLIEMIVVIAIFGIVTTIILANLPVFRDRSSLDLVAQEVAINIRGAQVFGGSGRILDGTSSRPTYGIHFSSSDPSTFLLYNNISGGKDYDEGNNGDPIVYTYALSQGFIIKELCADTCSADHLTSLDLAFTRPRLEPEIFADNSALGSEKVLIIIQSSRSRECRVVEVWQNGYIAVVAPDSIGGCSDDNNNNNNNR